MKDKEKVQLGEEAVYSLKQISKPQALLLGLQHTRHVWRNCISTLNHKLNISTALLMAGWELFIFSLVEKFYFLGSSFAFISGYAAVAPLLMAKQISRFGQGRRRHHYPGAIYCFFIY